MFFVLTLFHNISEATMGVGEQVDGLKANFYDNSQKIIERFYLQPLSQDNHGINLALKEKENLKDGFLERSVHGAMHVARVQLWCFILHDKIKHLFPEHIKAVLDVLSTKTKLNEVQIITLVRYVALFHD
jgi:hypothetical protein